METSVMSRNAATATTSAPGSRVSGFPRRVWHRSCTAPTAACNLAIQPACRSSVAASSWTRTAAWLPATRRRSVRVRAVELATVADFGDLLYEAGQSANQLVGNNLAGITPLTYLAVLGSGLATSLSPCTLSVLPLTIGYIGGYARTASAESESGGAATTAETPNLAVQAGCFSLGLATTLALLGVASSMLGSTYGSIGSGLPIAVSCLAILMGLNLLEVLPLSLPSLNIDAKEVLKPFPPALQAYATGLAFALAASPCATPVLATLLGWVATSQDPFQGGALLLSYTLGYVSPLLVAATITGSLKQLLALRQYSQWVTPASGALLVGGGTYTLLDRLVL